MYTATRTTTTNKVYGKKFGSLDEARAWIEKYAHCKTFEDAEISDASTGAWVYSLSTYDERGRWGERFSVQEMQREGVEGETAILASRSSNYYSREDTRPYSESGWGYTVYKADGMISGSFDSLEEARRRKAELDGEAD